MEKKAEEQRGTPLVWLTVPCGQRRVHVSPPPLCATTVHPPDHLTSDRRRSSLPSEPVQVSQISQSPGKRKHPSLTQTPNPPSPSSQVSPSTGVREALDPKCPSSFQSRWDVPSFPYPPHHVSLFARGKEGKREIIGRRVGRRFFPHVLTAHAFTPLFQRGTAHFASRRETTPPWVAGS